MACTFLYISINLFAKICYSGRDIEFFLTGWFFIQLAHPVYYYLLSVSEICKGDMFCRCVVKALSRVVGMEWFVRL